MGYIAVDDVAAYAGKVKAAGGTIHRGPAEIPNVGTFAVAGDPHGAGFLLFKGNGDGPPTPDQTAPGHIGWHELHAGDGTNAFAFYSGVFGWTKGEAMDMGPMGKYQLFTTQGPAAGRHDDEDAADAGAVLALLLQRRGDRRGGERVTSAGGKIVNGPMQVPGGRWIVQALDPQGAMFALLAPGR